jgi:phosphate transport system substrate-binding protein
MNNRLMLGLSVRRGGSDWFCVAAVAAMVGLSSCQRHPTIRIDGSSTVFPISEAAAFSYRERHPDVRVTVSFSGTGGGFRKLLQGDIDICNASRPFTEAEQRELALAGVECLGVEIARDGLAIVVNRENDWVNGLTLNQLRLLWQPDSRVRLWSDLEPAWPAREIHLFGPGPSSGTFDCFTESVCGQVKACRTDYLSSEDDNVLVRGVAGDKYALGYFGLAYFVANQQKLKLVGIDLGKGCVYPSADTIRANEYGLFSRALYIYVKKSSLERANVSDFVNFYVGNAAKFAAQAGYVPLEFRVQSSVF